MPGQQISIRRSLLWTPVQRMLIGDQEADVFHFHHAVYDLNPLLPNYYELLKIENNSEYEVRIQDPVFEEVDYEIIKKMKYLGDIPSEISIRSRVSSLKKQTYLQISFIPLRRNASSGRVEILKEFKLVLRPVPHPLKSVSSLRSYADHSVLSSGKWIRIKLKADGIYSLSYEQLREIGIVDPAGVRVYGNGGGMLPMQNNVPRYDDLTEIAIAQSGERILFYGQSPHVWEYDESEDIFYQVLHDYSDWTYYYLTSDLGPGLRVQSAQPPGGPANYTTTSGDTRWHHELEDINLIQSGREWYGEHFDIVTDQSFPMSLGSPLKDEDVRVRVSVVGRASAQTVMQVRGNGNLLGTLSMPGTVLGSYTLPYATPAVGTFAFRTSSDEVNISLNYIKNAPSAEAWLDAISANARVKLVAVPDPGNFRDRLSVGAGRVSEFVLEGSATELQIWDVTDPLRPERITLQAQGSNTAFTRETDVLREFVGFNGGGDFLTPVTEGEDVGPVPNQDLHSLRARNYVIISPPEFLSQARNLAAHRHDQDGLDTSVVTPLQIYHEFSSGSRDVSALRDFLKMLYDRAVSQEEMPRYVLLYGDGSYDNKGDDINNTNFIPTFQSENSLSPTSSFVTDDFFGLLDDNEGEATGLMDVGVGRFPVSSEEEARYVLEKAISYDQTDKMGDWRNTLCFIGDDEDNNIHMRQADELASYMEANYPDFILGKIYLDAYTQVSTPSGPRYPDVNEAISKRIEKGALIMNYTGHGGSKGLAHERIIRIEDVLSWKNRDRLPLFITATCEFSRFDEYEASSAGELVLLNPDGGGIALLTTTRLVYSGPNHALNVRFYEHAFKKDEQNRHYRLGDITRMTKNDVSAGINKRNFTLLGDPAMKLAYTRHRVRVENINGTPVTESIDTLRALGKVTVGGLLENEQGNFLEGFNGTVYPTVFDKASSITTLSNDDQGPMTFSLRNRILYKGKASVVNGRFSFSFIVPKDIAYNYGYGKLSFYAENGLEDASGSFLQAVVGGSADSVSSDTKGPELSLYMNDENFVFGGLTDENPVLLAFVSDSNGINTLGNGIGHDLTAILDGNTNQTIVLNDFYESDQDSYKSGTIRYSLSDLEAGRHSLKVKVWDVYNNSSEELIEFVVNTEDDLILDHVLNYPNPFTTHTQFYFEHNQPSTDLDVLIQVFTVSGKLVKTLEYHAPASGYRVGPVDWDGRDDYGSKIGRGVYIYRVKVRTSSGRTAEKYEKLVILN